MPRPADIERQTRFVKEFLVDRNGTQAAIRAGYAARGAHVTASRLLRDPKILGAVQAKVEEIASRVDVSVERTLREIARVAYGDVRRLYREDGTLVPVHELSDDAAALVERMETEELFAGEGDARRAIGFTRKVWVRSKLKALDQCMSYLGMHKTVAPGKDANSFSLSISLSGKQKR